MSPAHNPKEHIQSNPIQPKEKGTFERVNADVSPGANVGLGLVSELQSLLLGHDQSGRGTVGQEGRVRRSVGAWNRTKKMKQRKCKK